MFVFIVCIKVFTVKTNTFESKKSVELRSIWNILFLKPNTKIKRKVVETSKWKGRREDLSQCKISKFSI